MKETEIDWSNLSFSYMKTDYNVRCTYKDGKWGEIEVSDSEYVPMHIAASCLHYGQESFEGLKAFRGKDGKYEYSAWKRMQSALSALPKASRCSQCPLNCSAKWFARL